MNAEMFVGATFKASGSVLRAVYRDFEGFFTESVKPVASLLKAER